MCVRAQNVRVAFTWPWTGARVEADLRSTKTAGGHPNYDRKRSERVNWFLEVANKLVLIVQIAGLLGSEM